MYCNTVWCKVMSLSPSIISWHFVIFDYHMPFVVSKLALSSNDSPNGLRFCSLIFVAPMLTWLELHTIVFWVSWIMLIASYQGLPSLLSTNRKVSLWKNVLESAFSNSCFFENFHGMCKHCQIVIFHIFLGNVYCMFEQWKTLSVYLCISP